MSVGAETPVWMGAPVIVRPVNPVRRAGRRSQAGSTADSRQSSSPPIGRNADAGRASTGPRRDFRTAFPCRGAAPRQLSRGMSSGRPAVRQGPSLRAILRRSPASGNCSGFGSSQYACHPRHVNGYGDLNSANVRYVIRLRRAGSGFNSRRPLRPGFVGRYFGPARKARGRTHTTPFNAAQRASVGSTEAANEVVARFGVVGPKRARGKAARWIAQLPG